MTYRPLFITALCCIFLSCFFNPLYAESKDTRAWEVKAAYLLQFSKYVEWPEDISADNEKVITLCILGQDPFGSIIDQANRFFHDKKIKIKRINNLANIKNCQILFVGADQQQQMEKIIEAVATQPILLISDKKDFLERGGMINFIPIGKKIRFNINLKNCKNNQLKISSKLLKVANKVK